jgi:hypothetical protein
MSYLFLLLLIIGIFAGFSGFNSNAFGAATAGDNFCSAFPTHPECTGYRVEAIYDNFWFCQYVDLPAMCDNPPDPQKQIVTRIGNPCCGIIGSSHVPKNISLGDVSFADTSEKGKSLESSSSSSFGQELVIWTEKDHYSFGDRVNVYGKFDFDDPVLQNNNSFVDISLNDRKVVLDLPVHSNGWFAGYFMMSNPSLFYTGSNLISVTYFHTPTQHEPDKFTDASYRITTGDVVATEPFSINVKLSSAGKVSFDVISESDDNSVNLNFAIVRLETPEGLVFSLPNISSIDSISDYLDFPLVTGQYEITVTTGNNVVSQSFDYIE